MNKHLLWVFAFALVLAACGHYNAVPGSTGSGMMAAQRTALTIEKAVPPKTIGFELPGEGLGVIVDPKYGPLGGYTQKTRSQVIAFKPGVTITLLNLSKSLSHTLNVVGLNGFPANPTLIIGPSGGPLQAGYASGVISPGKSVTVTLSKAGIYYVGCYFHYHSIPSMRDVIKVKAGATPGPQATPTP